jgi:hypothetical protein
MKASTAGGVATPFAVARYTARAGASSPCRATSATPLRTVLTARAGTRVTPKPGGDEALLGGPLAGDELDSPAFGEVGGERQQGVLHGLVSDDPALRGELRQPQRAPLGEPVGPREGDQHRLVEKMGELDPFGLERKARIRADHRQVELAGREARQLAGRGPLDQRGRDLGVLCPKGRQSPGMSSVFAVGKTHLPEVDRRRARQVLRCRVGLSRAALARLPRAARGSHRRRSVARRVSGRGAGGAQGAGAPGS